MVFEGSQLGWPGSTLHQTFFFGKKSIQKKEIIGKKKKLFWKKNIYHENIYHDQLWGQNNVSSKNYILKTEISKIFFLIISFFCIQLLLPKKKVWWRVEPGQPNWEPSKTNFLESPTRVF